jgi:hypothetical protein
MSTANAKDLPLHLSQHCPLATSPVTKSDSIGNQRILSGADGASEFHPRRPRVPHHPLPSSALKSLRPLRYFVSFVEIHFAFIPVYSRLSFGEKSGPFG